MIRLDEGGLQRHARLLAPPPPLRGVVQHFCVQEALSRDTWRVVPDNSGHLIFTITQGPRGRIAGCRLVGARGTYADISVAGRILIVVARLRPGVLPSLLCTGAAQITDRSVPLDAVVGRAGVRLVEQMEEAVEGVGTEAAVALLARFLRERLCACQRFADLSTVLGEAVSVDDLARSLGLSRRRVYDRFADGWGLSPKRALRIDRLHRALIAMNQDESLAHVAAAAGFSDQAHFTRDARDLLGEPPRAWQRRGRSIVQDGTRQTD